MQVARYKNEDSDIIGPQWNSNRRMKPNMDKSRRMFPDRYGCYSSKSKLASIIFDCKWIMQSNNMRQKEFDKMRKKILHRHILSYKNLKKPLDPRYDYRNFLKWLDKKSLPKWKLLASYQQRDELRQQKKEKLIFDKIFQQSSKESMDFDAIGLLSTFDNDFSVSQVNTSSLGSSSVSSTVLSHLSPNDAQFSPPASPRSYAEKKKALLEEDRKKDVTRVATLIGGNYYLPAEPMSNFKLLQKKILKLTIEERKKKLKEIRQKQENELPTLQDRLKNPIPLNSASAALLEDGSVLSISLEDFSGNESDFEFISETYKEFLLPDDGLNREEIPWIDLEAAEKRREDKRRQLSSQKKIFSSTQPDVSTEQSNGATIPTPFPVHMMSPTEMLLSTSPDIEKNLTLDQPHLESNNKKFDNKVVPSPRNARVNVLSSLVNTFPSSPPPKDRKGSESCLQNTQFKLGINTNLENDHNENTVNLNNTEAKSHLADGKHYDSSSWIMHSRSSQQQVDSFSPHHATMSPARFLPRTAVISVPTRPLSRALAKRPASANIMRSISESFLKVGLVHDAKQSPPIMQGGRQRRLGIENETKKVLATSPSYHNGTPYHVSPSTDQNVLHSASNAEGLVDLLIKYNALSTSEIEKEHLTPSSKLSTGSKNKKFGPFIQGAMLETPSSSNFRNNKHNYLNYSPISNKVIVKTKLATMPSSLPINTLTPTEIAKSNLTKSVLQTIVSPPHAARVTCLPLKGSDAVIVSNTALQHQSSSIVSHRFLEEVQTIENVKKDIIDSPESMLEESSSDDIDDLQPSGKQNEEFCKPSKKRRSRVARLAEAAFGSHFEISEKDRTSYHKNLSYLFNDTSMITEGSAEDHNNQKMKEKMNSRSHEVSTAEELRKLIWQEQYREEQKAKIRNESLQISAVQEIKTNSYAEMPIKSNLLKTVLRIQHPEVFADVPFAEMNPLAVPIIPRMWTDREAQIITENAISNSNILNEFQNNMFGIETNVTASNRPSHISLGSSIMAEEDLKYLRDPSVISGNEFSFNMDDNIQNQNDNIIEDNNNQPNVINNLEQSLSVFTPVDSFNIPQSNDKMNNNVNDHLDRNLTKRNKIKNDNSTTNKIYVSADISTENKIVHSPRTRALNSHIVESSAQLNSVRSNSKQIDNLPSKNISRRSSINSMAEYLQVENATWGETQIVKGVLPLKFQLIQNVLNDPSSTTLASKSRKKSFSAGDKVSPIDSFVNSAILNEKNLTLGLDGGDADELLLSPSQVSRRNSMAASLSSSRRFSTLLTSINSNAEHLRGKNVKTEANFDETTKEPNIAEILLSNKKKLVSYQHSTTRRPSSSNVNAPDLSLSNSNNSHSLSKLGADDKLLSLLGQVRQDAAMLTKSLKTKIDNNNNSGNHANDPLNISLSTPSIFLAQSVIVPPSKALQSALKTHEVEKESIFSGGDNVLSSPQSPRHPSQAPSPRTVRKTVRITTHQTASPRPSSSKESNKIKLDSLKDPVLTVSSGSQQLNGGAIGIAERANYRLSLTDVNSAKSQQRANHASNMSFNDSGNRLRFSFSQSNIVKSHTNNKNSHANDALQRRSSMLELGFDFPNQPLKENNLTPPTAARSQSIRLLSKQLLHDTVQHRSQVLHSKLNNQIKNLARKKKEIQNKNKDSTRNESDSDEEHLKNVMALHGKYNHPPSLSDLPGGDLFEQKMKEAQLLFRIAKSEIINPKIDHLHSDLSPSSSARMSHRYLSTNEGVSDLKRRPSVRFSSINADFDASLPSGSRETPVSVAALAKLNMVTDFLSGSLRRENDQRKKIALEKTSVERTFQSNPGIRVNQSRSSEATKKKNFIDARNHVLNLSNSPNLKDNLRNKQSLIKPTELFSSKSNKNNLQQSKVFK